MRTQLALVALLAGHIAAQLVTPQFDDVDESDLSSFDDGADYDAYDNAMLGARAVPNMGGFKGPHSPGFGMGPGPVEYHHSAAGHGHPTHKPQQHAYNHGPHYGHHHGPHNAKQLSHLFKENNRPGAPTKHVPDLPSVPVKRTVTEHHPPSYGHHGGHASHAHPGNAHAGNGPLVAHPHSNQHSHDSHPPAYGQHHGGNAGHLSHVHIHFGPGPVVAPHPHPTAHPHGGMNHGGANHQGHHSAPKAFHTHSINIPHGPGPVVVHPGNGQKNQGHEEHPSHPYQSQQGHPAGYGHGGQHHPHAAHPPGYGQGHKQNQHHNHPSHPSAVHHPMPSGGYGGEHHTTTHHPSVHHPHPTNYEAKNGQPHLINAQQKDGEPSIRHFGNPHVTDPHYRTWSQRKSASTLLSWPTPFPSSKSVGLQGFTSLMKSNLNHHPTGHTSPTKKNTPSVLLSVIQSGYHTTKSTAVEKSTSVKKPTTTKKTPMDKKPTALPKKASDLFSKIRSDVHKAEPTHHTKLPGVFSKIKSDVHKAESAAHTTRYSL